MKTTIRRSFSYILSPLAAAALLMMNSAGLPAAEPAGPPWQLHVIDDSSRGADGVKLGDINGDGLLDIVTGWEEGGITRVYLNPGPDQAREAWPAVTVGKTPAVEDAVFVDVDGDGVLDVVSSCEGEERRIFVHWAPKKAGDLLDPDKWRQELLPASTEHNQQWMYAVPMDIGGKHGLDLVVGAKAGRHRLGWFEAPGTPRNLAAWKFHPLSPAGWVMSIWKEDMDGDGDLDIVLSDRKEEKRGVRWLENPGQRPALYEPWQNHYMGAREYEVLSMTLTDLDGDGLEDAVAALFNTDLLFMKRLDASGRNWEPSLISADYQAGNTRAVAVADLNEDGLPDIALTTTRAKDKHGVLWLEAPEWRPRQISGAEKGIKYDRIELIDLDGDGDLDLLTCEESEGGKGLGVIWYENPGS